MDYRFVSLDSVTEFNALPNGTFVKRGDLSPVQVEFVDCQTNCKPFIGVIRYVFQFLRFSSAHLCVIWPLPQTILDAEPIIEAHTLVRSPQTDGQTFVQRFNIAHARLPDGSPARGEIYAPQNASSLKTMNGIQMMTITTERGQPWFSLHCSFTATMHALVLSVESPFHGSSLLPKPHSTVTDFDQNEWVAWDDADRNMRSVQRNAESADNLDGLVRDFIQVMFDILQAMAIMHAARLYFKLGPHCVFYRKNGDDLRRGVLSNINVLTPFDQSGRNGWVEDPDKRNVFSFIKIFITLLFKPIDGQPPFHKLLRSEWETLIGSEWRRGADQDKIELFTKLSAETLEPKFMGGIRGMLAVVGFTRFGSAFDVATRGKLFNFVTNCFTLDSVKTPTAIELIKHPLFSGCELVPDFAQRMRIATSSVAIA